MRISKFVRQQLKGKKRLAKMPRFAPPKSLERQYESELVKILERMASLIRTRVLMRLPKWQDQINLQLNEETKIDADPSDEILAAFEEVQLTLNREYTKLEIERLAQKVGLSVSDYNAYILKNGFKRVVGIDLFFSQPYLKQELTFFANMNSGLIKDLTERTFNKVQSDVLRGFSAGTRWEEIAKDVNAYIDPLKGTTRSRARLIARDQVNKLNGQLTELRQNELGIKRYIWRTVGDERVRESHAAKDGQVFEWSDPPPDTGHPGEDIQCRCYAEPLVSDILETAQEPDINIDE